MKSVMKSIVLSAAAAGLAFAPIAAQANTRASDNSSVYTSAAVAPAKSSESSALEGESGLIILLLAAASIAAAIVIVANDSNGAN